MGSILFPIFYLPHIFFQPQLAWRSILQLLCYHRGNVAHNRQQSVRSWTRAAGYLLMRMCLAPGPVVASGGMLPQAFARKRAGHSNCGDGGLGPTGAIGAGFL
jgi:hypothetical protein